MRYFKHRKGLLTPKEVQEDTTSYHQENNSTSPKTEAAIVKNILLKQILKELNVLESRIDKIRSTQDRNSSFYDEDSVNYMKCERAILRGVRNQISSIPDILYTTNLTASNILEIKGVDGSSFELSLFKKAVGGYIYQLKNNDSGQTIDVILYSPNYFNTIQDRHIIDGYLIPDEDLSEALSQLQFGG